LLEGFIDEPDAFALNAIKRVSAGSGEYLSDDHTFQFLRKEAQFVPDVLVNSPHTAWSNNPKSLAQEAQERVMDLLENHTVPLLDEAVQKELDRIEQAAKKQIMSE
jgi:trimethylamine:corrinoid methyltransferase-like protein